MNIYEISFIWFHMFPSNPHANAVINSIFFFCPNLFQEQEENLSEDVVPESRLGLFFLLFLFTARYLVNQTSWTFSHDLRLLQMSVLRVISLNAVRWEYTAPDFSGSRGRLSAHKCSFSPSRVLTWHINSFRMWKGLNRKSWTKRRGSGHTLPASWLEIE